MMPLEEGVASFPQGRLPRTRRRNLDDPRGEGPRVSFDERLAPILDRKPGCAVGGRDDRDTVAEGLEQLDANPAPSEDRRDEGGRPSIKRNEVGNETKDLDARVAPSLGNDRAGAGVDRQTGSRDLERALGETFSHLRPHLTAEPVQAADIRMPGERPDVAETRRRHRCIASAREWDDLRKIERIDSGEVAIDSRVVRGDRRDRVDRAEGIALEATRKAGLGSSEDFSKTPLPRGELRPDIALHVVLVEDDARSGLPSPHEREITRRPKRAEPNDVEAIRGELALQTRAHGGRVPLRGDVGHAMHRSKPRDTRHVARMPEEMDRVEDGIGRVEPGHSVSKRVAVLTRSGSSLSQNKRTRPTSGSDARSWSCDSIRIWPPPTGGHGEPVATNKIRSEPAALVTSRTCRGARP